MFSKNCIRFIQLAMEKLRYCILAPTCILCNQPSQYDTNLCTKCQQDLPTMEKTCSLCAVYLPFAHLEPFICGTCLKEPPPFSRTYALFPYQTPVIQLITQLKFQHKLEHAHTFGHLLLAKIRHEWYLKQPLPDLILPVPLHPYRLRERGFNQTIEIARLISKHLAIPLDLKGTSRLKHTAAQSGLTAASRKRNVQNAFVVHRDYSGLTLAVVDDVMTTGATMKELCRALQRQGAHRIDVWCLARVS